MKRSLLCLLTAWMLNSSLHAQHDCSVAPAPSHLLQEISGTSRAGGPYTIPVVFHIYYDTTTYYPLPSCTEVENALDRLNESFNAMSNDTIGISSLFRPLIGDAQITFALARRDPQGNCISGIQYHYGLLPSQGAFTEYNTNRYFNVHVGYMVPSGGTYPQAYSPAYYPGDGIYVGGLWYNPLMAHEAGHWLGLMHTFGNSNGVGTCGNDFVFDTPTTDGSPGTCDTNRSVCTPGVIENVQNYMDYSSCYKMFTQGQVARIHGILDDTTLSRRETWTVPNLAFTGVQPEPSCTFTADFIAFRPSEVPCTYNAWVHAVMTEFTIVPDSVHWSVPGGNPSFHSGTDLDVHFAANGLYTITMTAYSDGVSSTVSRTMNIVRHPLDAIETYPFSENFENAFAFPDDHLQALSGWQLCNFTGYNSPTSIYVPQETGTVKDSNTVTLGLFNLDSLNHPYLSFRVAASHHSQSIRRKLIVRATNICNNASYSLELLYDSMLALSNTSGNFIPSGAPQWKQVNVNLSFLPHWYVDENIMLSVILEKDFTVPGTDGNFYLDNINVGDSTAMLPPVADFSIANKDFCYSPCYQLEFVDRSTNMPTAWNWQGMGSNHYQPVVDGCFHIFPIDSVPISLIVSNEFGSDTATQYIYTHTPPMFSITPSAYTICQGDTLMMTVPPADGIYTWANGPAGVPNPGLTLLNTVGDTAYALPVMWSGNNYYATLTNSYGCTRTVMVSTSQVPMPFLNISVPECVAPGDTVTLATDNTGGVTYNWSPAYGLSSTNSGVVQASPDSTMTYTVTASYSICSKSETFTLHVPNVHTLPASPQICEGDSILITLYGSDSYQWQPSAGSVIVFAGSDSALAYPASTTTYTVTGTVTGGCATSVPVQVEVFPGPLQPTIQQNGNVLTSSPADSYQWYLDGTLLSGATNQQLQISTNGSYHVVTGNAQGCTATSTLWTVANLSAGTIAAGQNISVFPNPSEGTFYFSTPDGISSVAVYSSLGQLLQQSAFDGKQETVQLNIDAAAGWYYGRVTTAKGLTATVKLLVVTRGGQ